MAATIVFKLSLLQILLSVSLLVAVSSDTHQNEGTIPSTCKRLECPSYDVIEVGNGYEIRHYNSTVLISNAPNQDTSLVKVTRTGFVRLFRYILGDNDKQQKIEMTAPVVTEAFSDGPTRESNSFVVSFFVPKENQANPPPANGLHVQRWKTVHAAVRQFGGFVKDSNVGDEVAALQNSIAGTKWADAIEKTRRAGHAPVYAVAQYNAPFEFRNRVNEIWFLFDIDSELFAV